MKYYRGYNTGFLGPTLHVPLPLLSPAQKNDLAPVSDMKDGILHYIHYSLALSRTRRFPYFTATNIDGHRFKKIRRSEVFDSGIDEWSMDERVREYQWGQALYDANKSDFQRGHMTKREDPQWGSSRMSALRAAQSTFFFTNCAPQVLELNARTWAYLETYIMREAAEINRRRVCVFTGPVLDSSDPFFVTPVHGERVQLPVLFWKVVYFSDDGRTLKRVGFLMGQERLLYSRGIASATRGVRLYNRLLPLAPHYTDFKDAETYQVNVATIESLSNLSFADASEPYRDVRPVQLILKEVDIPGKTGRTRSGAPRPGQEEITYQGLTL